jgi:hypothetical protein
LIAPSDRVSRALAYDALTAEFAGVLKKDVAIALKKLVQDYSRMRAAY